MKEKIKILFTFTCALQISLLGCQLTQAISAPWWFMFLPLYLWLFGVIIYQTSTWIIGWQLYKENEDISVYDLRDGINSRMEVFFDKYL